MWLRYRLIFSVPPIRVQKAAVVASAKMRYALNADLKDLIQLFRSWRGRGRQVRRRRQSQFVGHFQERRFVCMLISALTYVDPNTPPRCQSARRPKCPRGLGSSYDQVKACCCREGGFLRCGAVRYAELYFLAVSDRKSVV